MNNTTIEPIEALHEAYKQALADELFYKAYGMRKDLVRRLLKEESSVLINELYRGLLLEEISNETKSIHKQTQILNLIPLEKAWLVEKMNWLDNPSEILEGISYEVQYGTSRTGRN